MLLSQGARIAKTVCQLSRPKTIAVNVRQCYEYSYRSVPKPDIKWEIAAEVIAGMAWAWVFRGFYYHSGHFFGEFEYPCPAEWTDEELGIPPED